MAEEIKANIVVEMMGRPQEHLKEVMKDLVKKLDSEKGISVNNKKIHKPKVVEQKDKEGKIIEMPEGQELYSTFSEIEIGAVEMFDLIRIIFNYMPSHVEIQSPSEFKIGNFDFASILTEITNKMHQYDAIAKNAIMQNKLLVSKLQQMQGMMQGQGAAPQAMPQAQEEKPKKKSKGKAKKKK